MIEIKLALRNLLGAKLRTSLTVIVLSLSYVLIIWSQGLYMGIYEQAEKHMIAEEVGGGQYWQEIYDPYDPLTLADSHAKIPIELEKLIKQQKAAPILIRQASIYPNGRIQTVLMKGIDPNQKILEFPTNVLADKKINLPILIGKKMAKSTGLKKGDTLIVRWRDAKGTFDALDGTIAHIMDTKSPKIDKGQIWVPLQKMQVMADMPSEATVVVYHKDLETFPSVKKWPRKTLYFFLTDVRSFVKMKTAGAAVMYVILLFLALLAIFDTQVLSVFKRRKEIGTMMALGITRARVIGIFTFEGVVHGLLAAIFAAIWGVPLLALTAIYGIPIPDVSKNTLSFGMADTMFPAYGFGLVVGTVALVMISVTIVSYLPTRKISKLKPTDALRGKL
jgi:putative ABC transport system permease protein